MAMTNDHTPFHGHKVLAAPKTERNFYFSVSMAVSKAISLGTILQKKERLTHFVDYA